MHYNKTKLVQTYLGFPYVNRHAGARRGSYIYIPLPYERRWQYRVAGTHGRWTLINGLVECAVITVGLRDYGSLTALASPPNARQTATVDHF